MGGRMDGWVGRRETEWVDGWMEGECGWTDVWRKDGRVGKWAGRWLDGWEGNCLALMGVPTITRP